MKKKYILRNISRKDVLLGDLGYRIPAGKTANLLSPKSALTEKMIEKSAVSGSLAKVMGKYLVRVEEVVKIEPPPKTATTMTNVVTFPQKTKSFITIEVGELTDEELRDATTDEEAAFLQQLGGEAAFSPDSTAVPIAAKGEDGSGEPEV